jgi:hypothetical protein
MTTARKRWQQMLAAFQIGLIKPAPQPRMRCKLIDRRIGPVGKPEKVAP